MKFKENVSRELRDYLRELLQQYVKEIQDITAEELKDLKEWVETGHSPYENGDYICYEGGALMDFVNAARFINDQESEFD